jgi:hypothetical protein
MKTVISGKPANYSAYPISPLIVMLNPEKQVQGMLVSASFLLLFFG